MKFRDNRGRRSGTIRDNRVVEGVIGGWGPWKIEPPFLLTSEGIADGEFVSIPLPMTQDELRAQHEWASERSDRKQYRPESA